ncbi:MAG TPA: hypothetical protein VD908_10310 [Cytophagales bacterium]|nr:hypothetical protein [Cytophagales bacterium]
MNSLNFFSNSAISSAIGACISDIFKVVVWEIAIIAGIMLEFKLEIVERWGNEEAS